MKQFLGCMVFIFTMVVLSGCEWGSSGDSTWSDSYSWINFAGVYRPPTGKAYIVSDFVSSSSTASTTTSNGVTIITGTETISLGSGDGVADTRFTGTLKKPVLPKTVTVTVDSWRMADSNGDGILVGTDSRGDGTIDYNTGLISVLWVDPPNAGSEVFVTYTWVIDDGQGGGTDPGDPGNPGNPGDPGDSGASKIYSLTLSQTGNLLDAVDSRGVIYHGQISSMAQGGGDRTGNTSGGVVANFTMKTDGGDQIVGVLTGNYIAPIDNGAASADTTIGARMKVETNTDTTPDAVTTGRLLNRQMQGTYIEVDGSTGDIQGEAGGLTVTVRD
jgi:hypothetical protein